MRSARYLDPERMIGYARARFALPDPAKPSAVPSMPVAAPALPQPVTKPNLSVLTAQTITDLVTETIANLEREEQYPSSYADDTSRWIVLGLQTVVARTTHKRAPRLGRSKIANDRRSTLARHLPARPRRDVDKKDAVDALQRIIDLHRKEPDVVEHGVRMYLETVTRNQGAPMFRDRESAGVYCEFLRKLGYQPHQIAFLHYPNEAKSRRPATAPGAGDPDASEDYWRQKLPVGRLLRRHSISTQDSQGRLVVQVSYDNYTPTTAPGKQHRAFGFRTGIFAFAVWRKAQEAAAREAELSGGARPG